MSQAKNMLNPAQINQLAQQFGTPLFIYEEAGLREHAQQMLDFDAPYGLEVSYAMKANSNAAILKIFDEMGIGIDASSGFEVERAMKAAIRAEKIMLTSQELPKNLKEMLEKGIFFTACSIHQLEEFAKTGYKELAIRINPGEGDGFDVKVNVGGHDSSFGIWHENLEKVKEIARKNDLKIVKIHTHIGSGTDPEFWAEVAKVSASFLDQFPDAITLNLGGGFKVARVIGEKAVDIAKISQKIHNILEVFAAKTGRNIRLEIEPGTFLVANSGYILSTIQDIVATNKYKFLKLDSGMSEIIRPSYYGAEHPMWVLPEKEQKENYVVVGHACESADILTTEKGDGEKVATRELSKAEIGDLLLIGGTGAYCASMAAKNYNSFPEAAEVLVTKNGEFKLIRKRQSMEQITENELGL